MAPLLFNQDLVAALAAPADRAVRTFFQFCSYMGEIEGYLIVIALLYAAYDKRLAVQAASVVVGAMIVNHVLKILIKNPRPFVIEGTFLDNWAVSAANAAELAAEYSTPSGHAMAAAAVYGFLFFRIRTVWVRAALAAAVILTGVSRPVIGVHFVEDILMGWALGLGIAVLAHRYIDVLWRRWLRIPFALQAGALLTMTSLIWIATLLIDPKPLDQQPTAFVSYLGLFAGVLLAAPVEARRVNYEVGHGPPTQAFARFVLMLALLVGALTGLDLVGATVAPDGTSLGFGFRFARYALLAGVGLLAAPWLFCRLGLAQRS